MAKYKNLESNIHKLIKYINMKNEKVCCPQFNPTLWDEKTFNWDNKRFVKTKVFTLFYMPINFGSVMTKMCQLMEREKVEMSDGLLLADHTSKWNMDLYLATDKEIAGVENVTLSGKFFCKVYEGSFKNIGVWMKDFENYAKRNSIAVNKMYWWYTTCPKCAKKYGKNYVAIVANIE